jgi:hypothetical protein
MKRFALTIALIAFFVSAAVWLIVVGPLQDPGAVGQSCLQDQPTACGVLALTTIGTAESQRGTECLQGAGSECGELSLVTIAADPTSSTSSRTQPQPKPEAGTRQKLTRSPD